MNKWIYSFGPPLKIISICDYAIVSKEEKKKQNYSTHITFMKTHTVRQTEH